MKFLDVTPAIHSFLAEGYPHDFICELMEIAQKKESVDEAIEEIKMRWYAKDHPYTIKRLFRLCAP